MAYIYPFQDFSTLGDNSVDKAEKKPIMRAMMTLREQFIHVFSAFAAVSGVAEGTLSDRLLRSGGRFKRIRAGSDISTGTFERVVRWLSDNWPEGADWPEGVDRPGPAASSATVSEAAE